MARKVQQADIERMLELYDQLGTYAAVAREVGFSASTVRKYILENQVITPSAAVEVFDTTMLDSEVDYTMFRISNWGDLCVLTDDEKDEIKQLWKELVK